MNKFLLTLVVGTTTLFFATPTYSQETLVKDINSKISGLVAFNEYTERLCACGDYVYVSVPNRELWRTDGTLNGTIPLGEFIKGIQPGSGDPMKCSPTGILYFVGDDGIHGSEIWTTDGTAEGTRMVKDVIPGNSTSIIVSLGFLGNTFYYLTSDRYDGEYKLWKTNGTENTTTLVPDFPSIKSDTWAYSLALSDTHIFFIVVSSETFQPELWATDGTGANTVKIKNVVSYGIAAESIGSKILFRYQDPISNEHSLWSTDGTIPGTGKVKDFGSRFPTYFVRFKDRILFGANGGAWISDGTSDGTQVLNIADFEAGATVGDYFYGLVYGSEGYKILKTDGVSVTEYDINNDDFGSISQFGKFPITNNGLFLQYVDEDLGTELGFFDFTSNTFSLLKDINEGPDSSAPRAWVTSGDKAYFIADDGVHGSEMWVTDGTSEGTHMVEDLVPETGSAFVVSDPNRWNLDVSKDKLQLLVVEGLNETALYESDGTEEGTVPKLQTVGPEMIFLGKVKDGLVFFQDRTLYRTNAGSDNLIELKAFDVTNGFGYSHRSHSLGDKLILDIGVYEDDALYGHELWITDGTADGTTIIKDINPGAANGATVEGAVLGTNFVFRGTEPTGGNELWITDGAEAGTQRLKDIYPGSSGSYPTNFVAIGQRTIFTADDGVHGNELWVTDGTAEGTQLLVDLLPGSDSYELRNFREAGDVVFFSLFDDELGWTLWKSDGTTAGTQMVIDVIPGNDYSRNLTSLESVQGKFYFAADDGIHGQELWVTDGTESGTHVIDVVAGMTGSFPQWVTDINGIAYFKADASLWRTNGTLQGTFKVSNLEPFRLAVLNDWVYFSAYHPDYGVELFKVPFSKVDQQIIAEPIVVKSFGDLPFRIEATATSGLPVEITSSEELALNGNTASIVRPGSVTVTMRQEGDALFNAATLSETFCILPSKPVLKISSTSITGIVLESNTPENNQWSGPFGEVDANEKTYSPSETGAYKVRVVIEGCESEWSNEETVLITGIEKPEELLTLYPNPTVDDINIKTSGHRDDVIVNFLNIQGTPLDKITLRTGQTVNYSLQAYPSGIYLLKVETSQGTVYQKVVKK